MDTQILNTIQTWFSGSTNLPNWALVLMGAICVWFVLGKLLGGRTAYNPRRKHKRIPKPEEQIMLFLTKRDGKPMPSYVVKDGFPDISPTKLLHHISELKSYRYIGGNTNLELTKFGRAYLVKHNLVEETTAS